MVDQSGTKRAELSLNTSSEPKLILYKASGDPAIELATPAGEPQLIMYSPNNVRWPTVAVAADDKGGSIRLLDRRSSLIYAGMDAGNVGMRGTSGSTFIQPGLVTVAGEEGTTEATIGTLAGVAKIQTESLGGSIMMVSAPTGTRVDVTDKTL